MMASYARRERDSQVRFWVEGAYSQVLSFLLGLYFFFLSDKRFFVFLTILQINVSSNRTLA